MILSPRDFDRSNGTESSNGNSTFTIRDGDREPRKSNTVWEMLGAIEDVGKRGINITRYKGACGDERRPVERHNDEPRITNPASGQDGGCC